MTTARRTLIKGAAALRVMLSVATQGQKVPRRGVGWRLGGLATARHLREDAPDLGHAP
jgi:hypothetical protein